MKIYTSPFLSRALSTAILACCFATASLNAQVPVIDSLLAEVTNVDEFYTYTITATNTPTSFSAASLPAGLLRTGNTISGTPTQIGVYNITLFVQNADGNDLRTLELRVNANTPEITSSLVESIDEGDSFSYQITANNAPTSFNQFGLDAFPGLSFDSMTGLISGIPTSQNSGDVIIQAINSAGTATDTLVLSVDLVIPLITSSTTDNVTVGTPFTYQITANNYPTAFSATGLDAFPGLSLDTATGEISGTLTSGTSGNVVVVSSLNPADDATETLALDVIQIEAPITTSPTAVSTAINTSFFYVIRATNGPTTFGAVGTLPAGLSFTGDTISGTPTETGVFSIDISATNAVGTGSDTLQVTILSASAPATVSNLSVIRIDDSSDSPPPFLGDTTEISVSATVTPGSGETIDSVFVRWNNPPAKPDGTPRAAITLTSLDGPAVGGAFTGTINLGFDPENRELGGGNIDLEVVAYQTNAVNSDDFGSDTINFRVEPLLEMLFPDDNLSRSGFNLGDLFASARINTNDFDQVSARISGPGIVEFVTISQASNNGIYNFETTQAFNFTGIYQVRVEVLELSGASTVIERQLFITETVSDPVAVILTPTPGFTNEIFSPAFLSYTQSGAPEPQITVVGGVPITNGYNVTYALTLESGGQGYYPRDGTITLPATADTGVRKSVSDVVISNGRIVSLPATTVIFFSEFFDDDDDPFTPFVPEPRWGLSGTANLDNLQDPGANGKITITAEFFRSNAPLESYKIFVNGTDVTPFIGNGVGNLNPNNGDIDLPVFKYPVDGSPDAGDYVVTAQVIDQNGSVANAFPVSFQILPYEPLEILVSRQVAVGDAPDSPIIIGGSATFIAEIEPIDQIESVEFFESLSGVKLGDGSRVQIGGQTLYRSGIVFPEAGNFKVFARGTGFNGQTVISAPVDITVLSGEFPVVAITAPSSGSSVPAGANLEILIAATDPDGQITVVEVFNGNEPLGSATPTGIAGQYRLNLTPSVADAGVLNLIAQATDDRGNSTDSDVVTLGVVLGAVPQIEILSPAAGDEFFVDQPFEIRARITDADGTIASATLADIEFFTRVEGVNGTITVISDSLSFSSDVMSESSTPDEFVFIATINSPDVVGLVITARDNSGNETQSAPLQFTVTNGIVPDVAITAPLAGDSFTRGDIVTIDITSSDADGSVAQVEVFNGTASLGLANVVSTGNYRLNYAANAVGIVNLSARSTDNLGNVGISNIETISVVSGDLPTVTIDSPVADASYTQGDSIALEITADDADGFVTSVEIFNGEVLLGTALKISGDQYRYTIDTATAEIASGTLTLSARATDNIGNSGSDSVSVDLLPIVFSVSFIDPTGNPLELIAAAGEFFDTSYTFTVEVGGIAAGALQSLVWQLDSQDPVVQTDLGTELSFSESFTVDTCATLFVTATNTNGVAVTTSVAIGTSFPDPVSDSSDFVDYIYYQIRGTAPSQAEKDTAVTYLVNNGDNAATRAELTAGLYPDSQLLGSRQTLVALVYKTVTGQWPTAAEMESALLLLETDPEALVSQTVETQSGNINSGGSETFTFNYAAGTEVSIRVSPDGSNGNPRSDPTLTVNDPNGTFVGFSDDSIFGLDAVLTFTATQSGDYTATVRGFSSFQSGDFAIVSTSVSTESNNDLLLARVLVESLQDSYNAANGFLADTDVVNPALAPQFVAQIYRNKHGVGITNFNSNTLGARLTGTDADMDNGNILPGYSGDVLSFVAAFALDTGLAVGSIASISTPDGYPYTSELFYGRPNNPLSGWNAVATDLQDEFNITEAVSKILPNLENPDLTEYDGMTLEVALATIFIDPDFITQFPGSCVATPPVSPVGAAVASALLVAGEQQLTGLTDDADGDGDINLIEYALGGDPVDASNGAVVQQSIEAPALAAGPQTFVLTYLQLEERPAGMSIIVECSTDLIQWQAADPFSPVPAADQSGVPVGYERVEYRTSSDSACMFVRVAVQVE